MSAINVNSITGRTGGHGPVLTGVTTISGDLHVGSGISVTGISTLSNTVVGGATTELVVNGDARVTGVLTANNFTANDLTYPTSDGTAGQVLSTNGAGVLSFVNAITDVDQWRLRADVSTNGVLTNFERSAEGTATYIGAGMTHASGVWTFPQTGKWLIFVNAIMVIDDADSVLVYTEASTDGGSGFNVAATASDGQVTGSGSARNGSGCSFYFMDITNTSTHKVRINAQSLGAGSLVAGSVTSSETAALFIRLGDT